MLSRRMLALSMVSLPLAAAAAPLTLEALRKRLEPVRTLSADFVQRRELKGIRKPLVSSGHVTLVKGRGVLWDQSEPFVQKTTITRRGMLLELEGRKSAETPSSPGARVYAEMIEGLLEGDAKALEPRFSVAGISALPGGRWRLVLKPGDAALQRAFSRISVTGGRYVEALELESPDRERTTVEFSHIVGNGAVHEDLASRLDR